MKKIWIFILFLILLNSCTEVIVEPIYFDYFKNFNFNDPVFYNELAIVYWIYNNITYKSETDKKEFYQPPNYTLSKKSGDCEDFVILFLAILYYQFDIKGNFMIVDTGKKEKHAVALVRNMVYDPTCGSITTYTKYTHKYPVMKIIHYDDISVYASENYKNIEN